VFDYNLEYDYNDDKDVLLGAASAGKQVTCGWTMTTF